MIQAKFEEAARRLREAYGGEAIAPLREAVTPHDAEGAYAIQSINTRFWEANGRVRAGCKVGLTAKVVQAQLGVDQPDFGILFNDMEISDGGVLPLSSALQPKAEAEIAFILRSDLTGDRIDVATVSDAIGGVMAAIEIVDSRIADWKISFADTVADNGSSAFYVLSGTPKPLADTDLYSCGMVMEVNGNIMSLGAGAACLGHPLNAVTWLAQTMAARGESLRAGNVIMSGALGPMVAIKPGDVVRATIGGLGTASFSYGERPA